MKRMASNGSGALAIPSDKELFDIKSWDGITERCRIPAIGKAVDEQVQCYYSINVADAMKKLTIVGNLLQLAYSSSKGFRCNVTVVKVLSRYQDLIKDSVVTSSTFVEVILKALTFHKLALLMADKGKCEKGLTFLVKCEDLAKRMADESDKLIKMADDLSKMSEDALIKATEDQTSSEEEKRKVIEAAKRYEEDQRRFQTMYDDLRDAVEEAKREEEKYTKAAEKHELKGIIGHMPLVAIFTTTMGSKAYKAAEREREKEAEANKLRKSLQKEAREANAELAKLICQLQNSVVKEDELDKSIKALEITIKTMGQIKTVFLNVKKFWVGVQKHCISLTDKSDLVKELLDDREEFKNEIKCLGYNWLALGKINLQAAKAMRSVDDSVDEIMTNLPDKEESKALVDELTQSILLSITMENKMMDG